MLTTLGITASGEHGARRAQITTSTAAQTPPRDFEARSAFCHPSVSDTCPSAPAELHCESHASTCHGPLCSKVLLNYLAEHVAHTYIQTVNM